MPHPPTSWSSLANAPPPACLGFDHADKNDAIAVCELNARIVGRDNAVGRDMTGKAVAVLPSILAASKTADPGRSAVPSGGGCRSSAKTAFLSPKRRDGESLKRFLSVWQEDGWMSAVEDLCGDDTSCRLLKAIGKGFVSMQRHLSVNIYGLSLLQAGLALQQLSEVDEDEMAEKFGSTRNWLESPFRCLSWHPHTCKLAVAMRDDSIQVHTAAAGSGFTLLKHKQQRGVRCMAWKPFYASELAVGCSTGLLVWTVDPCSVVARPSASCVSVLPSPAGHRPVTGMEWQPNGELLLTCSAADSSIVLWNTASEAKAALRRAAGGGGGGYHLVTWAPDGRNVFAASTGSTFRVWSTDGWTQQRWNVSGGRRSVRTACWSADSSTLLYATDAEAKVFCIRFRPDVLASDDEDRRSVGAAVTVVDLDRVTYTNDITDETVVTGGLVQSMRWSATGERLVISFVDSNLLAVFQTEVTSVNISVCPIGFVSGVDECEYPCCFEFAKHFEDGSLLTIAWSSGRVQHFPMFFATANKRIDVPSGITTSQEAQRIVSRQLSTSHLLNHSLNALAEFEPEVFSSPAVQEQI